MFSRSIRAWKDLKSLGKTSGSLYRSEPECVRTLSVQAGVNIQCVCACVCVGEREREYRLQTLNERIPGRLVYQAAQTGSDSSPVVQRAALAWGVGVGVRGRWRSLMETHHDSPMQTPSRG